MVDVKVFIVTTISWEEEIVNRIQTINIWIVIVESEKEINKNWINKRRKWNNLNSITKWRQSTSVLRKTIKCWTLAIFLVTTKWSTTSAVPQINNKIADNYCFSGIRFGFGVNYNFPLTISKQKKEIINILEYFFTFRTCFMDFLILYFKNI